MSETQETKSPMKCLYPDCKNHTYARGLCNACYAAATRAVKNGLITWGELEKDGKSIAPIGGSYKSKQKWFLKGVSK